MAPCASVESDDSFMEAGQKGGSKMLFHVTIEVYEDIVLPEAKRFTMSNLYQDRSPSRS
jgi:hypothetical protein